MKSPITGSKINWLIAEDVDPLYNCTEQDFFHEKLPIPEDIGEGFLDIMNLSLGMTLGHAEHRFKQNNSDKKLPFADIEGELSEPTLIIHTLSSGNVLLHDKTANTELHFDEKSTVFQHIDKIHYSPSLDTRSPVDVTVLHIGKSTLDLLLGKEQSGLLLNNIGISQLPSSVAIPIPKHLSFILHSIHQSPLTGELRKLHAQAKVLDYLCLLTEYLDSSKAESTNMRDAIIHNIANDLRRLDGKIPPLTEIAEEYKIPLKTMNDGFKKVFDTTVYRFISDCRLDEAHAALLQTDIPMKALSAKLGYSHVNHFINAFKKRFDVTPGSLRK